MTEPERLACRDTMAMLEFVRRRASERKLRLFGVACARRFWDRIEDDRSRRAVDAAERYSDGLLGIFALEPYADDAWTVRDELWDAGPEYHDDRLWLAEAAAFAASVYEWRAWFHRPGPLQDYPFRLYDIDHDELLHDIIGNPFRPVAVDPCWLTSTVVALANTIYTDRAFDRLPILADALQDAGCEDAELLAHCRGPGPHVRGCWAVDRVLGKA